MQRRKGGYKIIDILETIDKKYNNFSIIPVLVAKLPQKISFAIGEDNIYITEFVIAKVKGLILSLKGHPEVTDTLLIKMGKSLKNPEIVFQDIRSYKKYLFINTKPLRQTVVEIARKQSGKSEINTIHLINDSELKRLEKKFPVIYKKSRRTP